MLKETTTKVTLENITSENRIKMLDDVFNKLNAELTARGKKAFTEKQKNAQQGGNGFEVGQSFTLTGNVGIRDIADSNNTFLAAETTTGDWLSLKYLIPVNVLGYSSKGEFIEEYEPTPVRSDYDTDTEYNEAVKEHETNIITATFDKRKAGKEPAEVMEANKLVCNHRTRNVIELYGFITNGLWSCKGLTLTFLGKVCKQTKAKKEYEFGEYTVKKGAQRVNAVNVWGVTK